MKTLKLLTVILVCAVVTAFTLKTTQGYNIGDVVDNFSLKNIDGKTVSLDDYKDQKGVIVIFTCNHCPYSKMYEDRIIALDKAYKTKGYPVVAINPNDPAASPGDDFESMKLRAKEKGFTFPYLYDDGQKVYPKFGATRTPHVFLLSKNKDKKFAVSYIGAIDDNAKDEKNISKKYIEDAIAAIVKGAQPEMATTKAIGCSIKVVK